MQQIITRTISRPSARITAFHHALLLILSAVALLLLAASIARAQFKSVESFPDVNNAPLRLRLVDGPHGREIIGARLTLTGGYDERDLKLKMWRAEIKTDSHGEATIPRMIANLPLLTIKGAHLSPCEGNPQQGYYSIEEIRSQGLSTVNGCGTSASDVEPGIITLVVERKSGDAKLEKKSERKSLEADAKNNHEKIYRTNGTLAPADPAPANNAPLQSTNSIDPAQLNFTAPKTPLQPPTPTAPAKPATANSLKPTLFALNSKPTLMTAISNSEPPLDTTSEIATTPDPQKTSSPASIRPLLSAMGMADGIVAGAQTHASLHKIAPAHRATKIPATKIAAEKKSPATAANQSAEVKKPLPPAPGPQQPKPAQPAPATAITPSPAAKPKPSK